MKSKSYIINLIDAEKTLDKIQPSLMVEKHSTNLSEKKTTSI